MAVEHPRQHKHQIRQAVQVLPWRLVQGLGRAQGHQRALSTPRHGAPNVRQGSSPGTRRQDKFLQLGQAGIVFRQRLVQCQHSFLLEQLVARDRQFTAQIEQLVLNFDQQRANTGRHVFAQQHPQLGVKFVDLAHGVHPQVVF